MNAYLHNFSDSSFSAKQQLASLLYSEHAALRVSSAMQGSQTLVTSVLSGISCLYLSLLSILFSVFLSSMFFSHGR